jgi:hypothetical protein
LKHERRRATRAAARLPAGDDLDEFELFAVDDGVRDRDGCLAADHHDRVRPDVARLEDVGDSRLRASKLDALGRAVEAAADGDFGRNPSSSPGTNA